MAGRYIECGTVKDMIVYMELFDPGKLFEEFLCERLGIIDRIPVLNGESMHMYIPFFVLIFIGPCVGDPTQQ